MRFLNADGAYGLSRQSRFHREIVSMKWSEHRSFAGTYTMMRHSKKSRPRLAKRASLLLRHNPLYSWRCDRSQIVVAAHISYYYQKTAAWRSRCLQNSPGHLPVENFAIARMVSFEKSSIRAWESLADVSDRLQQKRLARSASFSFEHCRTN